MFIRPTRRCHNMWRGAHVWAEPFFSTPDMNCFLKTLNGYNSWIHNLSGRCAAIRLIVSFCILPFFLRIVVPISCPVGAPPVSAAAKSGLGVWFVHDEKKSQHFTSQLQGNAAHKTGRRHGGLDPRAVAGPLSGQSECACFESHCQLTTHNLHHAVSIEMCLLCMLSCVLRRQQWVQASQTACCLSSNSCRAAATCPAKK